MNNMKHLTLMAKLLNKESESASEFKLLYINLVGHNLLLFRDRYAIFVTLIYSKVQKVFGNFAISQRLSE